MALWRQRRRWLRIFHDAQRTILLDYPDGFRTLFLRELSPNYHSLSALNAGLDLGQLRLGCGKQPSRLRTRSAASSRESPSERRAYSAADARSYKDLNNFDRVLTTRKHGHAFT